MAAGLGKAGRGELIRRRDGLPDQVIEDTFSAYLFGSTNIRILIQTDKVNKPSGLLAGREALFVSGSGLMDLHVFGAKFIIHAQHREQISGWQPVYKQFITGTASALRFWLLISGPAPI